MRTPALLAAFCLASAAVAQPLYTVTDLGRHSDYTFSTVALSLNNQGQVCGWVQGSNVTRAFVWSEGTGIQLLPLVPGNESRGSVAVDINDLGEVVGYSGAAGGSNINAWVFRNGAYTMLGSLPGYGSVTPEAINNHSQVIGSCTPATTTFPSEDFYWSPASGIRDFIPGQVVEPYDINDAGIVTGGVRTGDPAPGLMTWDGATGQATDLGKLSGGDLNFGYAINEAGHVAGVSVEILTPSGARLSHAVTTSAFGLQDLGQYQSVAIDINESGAVVGWRTNGTNSLWYSWLYRPGLGVITDLRTVIDDPALYTRISEARGINDAGQIIATTTLSSGTSPSRRAVILTPIRVCGSADFNGDGDTGTDQDIEAFFACLAGACCPSCDAGGSDFNHDGDSGTDQDIEAFFRVLGGHPC